MPFKHLILFTLCATMAQVADAATDFLKPDSCLKPSKNYFCFGGILDDKFTGTKNGTAGHSCLNQSLTEQCDYVFVAHRVSLQEIRVRLAVKTPKEALDYSLEAVFNSPNHKQGQSKSDIHFDVSYTSENRDIATCCVRTNVNATCANDRDIKCINATRISNPSLIVGQFIMPLTINQGGVEMALVDNEVLISLAVGSENSNYYDIPRQKLSLEFVPTTPSPTESSSPNASTPQHGTKRLKASTIALIVLVMIIALVAIGYLVWRRSQSTNQKKDLPSNGNATTPN